jgi:hypothetical protein
VQQPFENKSPHCNNFLKRGKKYPRGRDFVSSRAELLLRRFLFGLIWAAQSRRPAHFKTRLSARGRKC